MFDSVRCWCNFLRVAQKLDATQRARKSKTRTINGHDVQLLARLFLKFTIFYETAVDGSTIVDKRREMEFWHLEEINKHAVQGLLKTPPCK